MPRPRRLLGAAMLPLTLAAVLMLQPAAPPTLALWPDAVPLFAPGDAKPTVTVYKAAVEGAAPAVVVCPGGGYGALAIDHEGEQVAKFLNSLGVHAFVLKYRLMKSGRPGPLLDAPMLDAQRAIRTVRAKAGEFGVDPAKVGVWGFSAGGHLASTAGTHFDAGKADAADAVERQSCRPDFLILAYPVISMQPGTTHGGSRRNLLGDNPAAELVTKFSNELQVTKETPPTFLFHTDEDTAVPPENAVLFYLALKKAKVPAELHVYAKGVHGVGLGNDPKWTKGVSYNESWPKHLADWLAGRGVTAAKGK